MNNLLFEFFPCVCVVCVFVSCAQLIALWTFIGGVTSDRHLSCCHFCFRYFALSRSRFRSLGDVHVAYHVMTIYKKIPVTNPCHLEIRYINHVQRRRTKNRFQKKSESEAGKKTSHSMRIEYFYNSRIWKRPHTVTRNVKERQRWKSTKDKYLWTLLSWQIEVVHMHMLCQ